MRVRRAKLVRVRRCAPRRRAAPRRGRASVRAPDRDACYTRALGAPRNDANRAVSS
jgi:hypothetical protein